MVFDKELLNVLLYNNRCFSKDIYWPMHSAFRKNLLREHVGPVMFQLDGVLSQVALMLLLLLLF